VKSLKNSAEIIHTPSWSELIRLTLPQMGLMLCHLAISMTDIWAAGRMDAQVQASIGVVAQIFALLMLVTSLIGSGCMATVSQSLGAGMPLRAGRYGGLILMLSVSTGTAVALLALLFEPWIFTAIQVPAELRPVLSSFFTAYCCQLPFYYGLIMMNSIFRAHKKVFLPLLTLFLMAAGNIIGDLGVGLGWFGIPAFGARGLAWTTFACALLGFGSNVMLGCRYHLLARRFFAPWRWCRAAMPYLFRVGMPAAAGQILTQFASLTTLAIIGMLPEGSTQVLAGMSTGARIHAILLFPLGALNMSMVIFSGHLLGGGRRDTLYAFGRKVSLITGLVLIVPSVFLWIFREQAAEIFSQDSEVIRQAMLFLSFACLSGPLAGMTGVLNGVFSGAGATAISCRISAITGWILGIPCAWLLGIICGWGAFGIYAAGLLVKFGEFFWTILLFRRKKWLEYGLRKRHTA
jgi:MATE family multidrug resistance protein